MVLEAFLDKAAEYIKEYLKHSSLSPEDAIILAILPFFLMPLLLAALKTESKWMRFLFLAANSVIALMPVLYMKIYDKHDPLTVFIFYSIAILLLFIALLDVLGDLILFGVLKLIDFVFFVLEKVLRNKNNQ